MVFFLTLFIPFLIALLVWALVSVVTKQEFGSTSDFVLTGFISTGIFLLLLVGALSIGYKDYKSGNAEWSKKRRDNINCSRPKGFSQKAHCASVKKYGKSGNLKRAIERNRRPGSLKKYGKSGNLKKYGKSGN